ncbi:MAG: polyribonucleotide nucleotidyltransferase [Spirochaetota bacterium]
MKKTYSMKLGKTDFIIETGEIAKQANGSVIAYYGESSLLAAVTMGKDEPNQNFFPLSVHYSERFYAVGKIPGGFYKREGKPRDKEILISRVIDRSLRPLFPEGFRQEVQVIPMVIASDQENPTDIHGLNASSIALMISDIPFYKPVSAVRIGFKDNEFLLKPEFDEVNEGSLDLIVAGTKDDIVMIEGGATELSNETLVKALEFAHKYIKEICDFQEEIAKDCGKEKKEVSLFSIDDNFRKKIFEYSRDKMFEAMSIKDKLEKYNKIDEVKEDTINHFEQIVENDENIPEEEKQTFNNMIKPVLEEIEYEVVRDSVLKQGIRIDGRKCDEIRDVSASVDLFRQTHGSSLFTRGETQSMSIVTLGTSVDEQRFDDLEGEGRTNFMLHYNFPKFSVGEVGRVGPPGRREIGHGKLAERALANLLPDIEFPYTIRVVSEILESNGSSSMATVCAGSLALFAAGVPMKASCAGISIGLISDEESGQYKLISDIQGLEDHMGDMDFKVAGTKNGITSVQLDIKLNGIPISILKEGFEQALEARLKILDYMDNVIIKPREELSEYAPKIIKFTVDKNKIKDVIGPGGKVIKNITEVTGAQIIINDEGVVNITSKDEKSATEAYKMVEEIIADVEVGKVYEGTVKNITNFGAFVEVLPGKEGLCHIKDLSNKRIRDVRDVVREGEKLLVLVKEIDRQGRINLSHKDALKKRSRS